LIPPKGALRAYPHVIISVAIAEIWYFLGFLTVILRIALSEAPRDYIEVAEIDGAT